MPRCARKECRKEFQEENFDQSCVYHPGGPVFHEGLKSWSCCSKVNKPVLDFDEFMKIPGCTTGTHTVEVINSVAPASKSNVAVALTAVDGARETYSHPSASSTSTFNKSNNGAIPSTRPSAPTPLPVIEEEEDLNATVQLGTICRHKGCVITFVSDEVNRVGDGEGTVCTYHPGPPLFHEGSKGYLCCKRRVLEFDEFLKIPGCKTGRHLFVPKAPSTSSQAQEDIVNCRYDHYQTPTEIHMSVYAKQADQEQSRVHFEENHIVFDICLPAQKRFRRTLNLFGPIDPSASTVRFLGSKVEVKLKKSDHRSWTLLERTDQDLGNISFTFGVEGRVGTIGGNTMVLSEGNKRGQ